MAVRMAFSIAIVVSYRVSLLARSIVSMHRTFASTTAGHRTRLPRDGPFGHEKQHGSKQAYGCGKTFSPSDPNLARRLHGQHHIEL